MSKAAYLDAPAEDRAKALGLLQGLLVLLRAQYIHYQTSHWQVVGDAAYGNHLLFQRIYDGDEEAEGEDDEGIAGEIDALAEKMIGMFGPEAVNAVRIASATVPWLVKWSAVECLHRRSLEAEKDLQQHIRGTYETLKLTHTLSLGMDDFLMSLASEHETNEYLVQQVLDQPSKTASGADPWATWTFRRTP